MLELFNKILVIAAHPDDEILGVGGTIPLLVKMKKSVDILIFTDGSSTQYFNNDAILEDKFGEAKEANNVLGSKVLPRLDFPDMRLDTIAHVDLNIALGNIIKEGEYDTIFIQDKTDINKDHNELFESTLVVCRPYPGQKVKHLLSYYVNSSTEWGNLLKKEPIANPLQRTNRSCHKGNSTGSKMRSTARPRNALMFHEKSFKIVRCNENAGVEK